MTRKDFTQNALDVLRRATGEVPKQPPPAPKPGKAASKPKKGATKLVTKRR